MNSATTQKASMKIAKLDDATIHRLFGSFDAETEDESRFTDYFVTNEFYERFVADFPLRIAVGNKGTGKSAIIRRAYIDDMKRTDAVCVSMNAADLISRAGEIPKDGLKAINHWKVVFAREAASQMLTATIAENVDGEFAKAISSLPNFLSLVSSLLSKKTGGATDVALKAGLDLGQVKTIVFYLDDLDREWDGRGERLHFVNSLLNACYDISKKEKNIRFKIGIRWDLWDAISGVNQDIDKIRQNAVFLRWTNHEIYLVVAKRVASFFSQHFPTERYLTEDSDQKEMEQFFDPILEPVFRGYGKWDGAPTRHVILSMTRNRPRDLLSLLTIAAEEANRHKRTRITSTDLQAVFPRYSEERLNDLVVEFGTRLSELRTLLLSFKPSQSSGKAVDYFRFTNDKMTKHLQAVIKTHGARVRFAQEKAPPDWRRLLDFLYRIDFLSAWFRKSDDAIERVSFQDRQLAVIADADFGYSWEVLPAYRWAIQPTKLIDVIASLR